jgi:hypothetical protein
MENWMVWLLQPGPLHHIQKHGPSALQIRTGGQVLEFGLNEKEHLSFKEARPEETTHE